MSAATDEAAPGEETPAAALRWVCALLDRCSVPFQVTGDVAAVAHGAARPIRRVELFVAADHVPEVIRRAREHIVDHPWRRMDDAWDRVNLSLSHEGVPVDICVVEAARFKDAATGGWRAADIDLTSSETLRAWDIEVPVMPRGQLLDQKRRLDREIDRRDARDIAGSEWTGTRHYR